MLHVVRPDGTIEEVSGAVAGAVEAEILVCRDSSGQVVRTFDHTEVVMFGSFESVRKGVTGLAGASDGREEEDGHGRQLAG